MKQKKQMIETKDEHDLIGLAMLRYRTLNTAILSFGGIMSLVIGALVLVFGSNVNDSAVIEFLGVKVDAKGFGAVILSSSIFWAFFAYRSRPTYGISTKKSTITDQAGTEHIIIEKEIYDCSVEECIVENDSDNSKKITHTESHVEKTKARKI